MKITTTSLIFIRAGEPRVMTTDVKLHIPLSLASKYYTFVQVSRKKFFLGTDIGIVTHFIDKYDTGLDRAD